MQKANLCLHAGGYEATLAEVAKVSTPMATETHFPVPHIALYDETKSALDSAGFEIVNEQHALAARGDRYFGLVQVVRKGAENGVDYARILGLRNSHDKSFPAGAVLGSEVFVCDNLSFFGEIKMARRHTVWIMRDLSKLIFGMIAKVTEKWFELDMRYKLYKTEKIDREQVDHVLISAMEHGVVPVTKLPAVLREWKHPSFDHGEDGTVWRLFNAFTQVMKGGSLFELPQRTEKIHSLCDGLVDFEDFIKVPGTSEEVGMPVYDEDEICPKCGKRDCEHGASYPEGEEQ